MYDFAQLKFPAPARASAACFCLALSNLLAFDLLQSKEKITMTELYRYKSVRRTEPRYQAVGSTSSPFSSPISLARTRAARDSESDNDDEDDDDESESESDDEEFENVLQSTPTIQSTFTIQNTPPATQSISTIRSTTPAIQTTPTTVQPTLTALPEPGTSLILVVSSSNNIERPTASFSTTFATSVSYDTLLVSATSTLPASALQPAGALKESSSPMPAGRIAYISIGAIAGAACLAASIFVLWGLSRRRRRALREVKVLRAKTQRMDISGQETQSAPGIQAMSMLPDEKHLDDQRSLQQRDSISRITSYYLGMPKPDLRRPLGVIPVAPPDAPSRAQPRPNLGLALPTNPRAQVSTITGPEVPRAPRPTMTQAFIRGVPLLPDEPQLGAPPSTLSMAHTVFIPQNRASITPSESASNLPEHRQRIDREIEELEALIAARKLAERGGYDNDRYQNEQQWV
jgi:hypothetical protein